MEQVQRALHQKHGNLIRIAHNEVACADPDAIKKIYPAQGALEKSDFYPVWRNPAFSKYSDNFSETSEKLHGERRRIVNHLYTTTNVLQSEQYIDRCSQLFVDRVAQYADNGQTIDLGVWLQWYTFDVIGELFFGQMFGFMDKEEDHKSYIACMDALMPVLLQVSLAPQYYRPFIFMSSALSSTVRKALKSFDVITNAAKECVARRVDNEAKVVEEAKRNDIMQQLLDIVHEKGDKVDFKIGEVQFEAFAALFAGSDTTAIALRAVFYFLLKSPETYRDLQQEISDATRTGAMSVPPKFSEAQKLPLLCATIKEAMRLHPSVQLTMQRLAPKEGIVLCDKFVPAGYRVGINPAVVQYDTSVFGADSNIFRPRRWLEDEATTRKMDNTMLVFGAGTRTCIGKNISLVQIHKLVPFVLQQFDLKLTHPNAVWETDNKWFNKQSGIDIKLSRH
ncbi:hypothetical protein LTR64_007248 [Lithohypha guttulata]|uniref:uncharacterized protein n=1 Tax=Lithohypha guttulata TaxID=1690604 RepID=UPI00315CBFB6